MCSFRTSLTHLSRHPRQLLAPHRTQLSASTHTGRDTRDARAGHDVLVDMAGARREPRPRSYVDFGVAMWQWPRGVLIVSNLGRQLARKAHEQPHVQADLDRVHPLNDEVVRVLHDLVDIVEERVRDVPETFAVLLHQ